MSTLVPFPRPCARSRSLPGETPRKSLAGPPGRCRCRVTHRDFHRAVSLPGRNSDPPSLRGELHRVGKEIEKDLLDLPLIPDEITQALVDRDIERDTVPCGALAHKGARVIDAKGRSNVASSSSIRPASTLDRSRISLMRDNRWRPDVRISSVYSACFSFSSPNSLSPRTSEKPMIALSGVRSSWDMLARNSDLCRLAASICWLFSSISRNSRAFWIARADWVAKV